MTLRSKTSILLALFILVIFSVWGFLSLRFLENSLRASIFDGLETVSSTSSESIANFIEDTLKDTQIIASSLPKKALEERNAKVIEGYLKAAMDLYPKFENGMFILDAKGTLWADYPIYPGTRGKNFAFREYFKTTMEHQKGFAATPYRSARTGEPVLTFTALLRGSSNQILGLLGCSVQLLHPGALGGIRNTRIGESGYIYVFDTSRLMLLHPEDRRVLLRDVPPGANRMFDDAIGGFEGVGETINSKGVEMLLSIKHISGTNWILGAQQPKSEAYASIQEARNRIIRAAGIAVIVAISIGALAVRRLTGPLVKLRKVTTQLGQEPTISGQDFQMELKTIQSHDEIGDLARAFQGMHERLNKTFVSLQEALREWERTFDAVEEPIFILDMDRRIQRLNRSATILLGIPEKDALGIPCYRLIHGTETPPDYCPHRSTMETGKPARAEVEEPFLKGFFEISTTPILNGTGRMIGSVQVVRDVTERKQTEKILRESEERYRSLAEAAHDMIFIINREGLIQYVNHFAAKQLHSSPENLIGKSQEKFFPPDVAKRHKKNLNKVFQTGQPFYEENVTSFPEGERWLGTQLVPLKKESGEVGVVLGVSRDITQQKQMEEALRNSEEKYRSLVDNANDAIFIAQDGKVKFPNPSTLRLTGFSEKEYATLPFVEILHPEDREMVLDRHRRRLRGEPVPNNYSFRVFNKAGDELWVQLNAVLIEWEEKPAVLCFLRDITPEKRLETQFLQAQKMEAVGTLAGGISHDFNNLLQTVLGYAEILLMEKGKEEAGYQELQEIKRSAQRGAELTQQLLTFSRRVQSKLRPVNLNQEVGQVEKILKRTIPKMIEIDIDLAADLKVINADPGQMEQILMNLAVNARDAMPEGGALRIETRNAILDEVFCKRHLEVKPGQYVQLSVSDTGTGMEEETRKHIFEPFYTTKGVGKGTGLGLSMVYGIVKSHDGFILCESEPGEGTTFDIYLPVIERRMEINQADREEEIRGGTERILLVDDEEAIRELGRRMLTNFGYTLVTASDGEEALKIYQDQKEGVDLIILDLLMPGIGGPKCLEELLRINPEAKIVIASGYSVEGPPRESIEARAKAFINKPYDVKQILKVVRNVLERK